MSFILIDDFNGNINIICKDDGSGEPLILANLKDAETLLDDCCQNGIIVPLSNTIGVIKRVKEILYSGKINIDEETLEDRKNFLEIRSELSGILEQKIEPAPDNWDRAYSVDFFIKVKDKFIGIQIKPIASGQALNQYQWIEMHMVNHQKFESEFGGKVFFVYSTKSTAGKKKIHNIEVIDQIRAEIERLS